jgi:hypothetical protein
MLPPSDQLSICFAHVAYQLHERFSALHTGIGTFAVRDLATLEKRVGEADVLVISGLWRDSLLGRAQRSGALVGRLCNVRRCWKSTPMLVRTWRMPRKRVSKARSRSSIPGMRGTSQRFAVEGPDEAPRPRPSDR